MNLIQSWYLTSNIDKLSLDKLQKSIDIMQTMCDMILIRIAYAEYQVIPAYPIDMANTEQCTQIPIKCQSNTNQIFCV